MAKKLPAVPSDLPVALRNWCYSAAKTIDDLDGSTGGGAGVDFALRTDVKDILLRVGDHDDTIGGHDKILGKGGDIDHETIPPEPDTFSITSVGELIGLNWTYPETYHPGLGHNRTLIYRTPALDENDVLIDIGLVSPLTEQSYLVGYSETSHFRDVVGYNEAFYYWIQFASTGGVLGTVSDVVLGQTDISISERMKAASDYIDGTSLAQDLRSTINSVFTGANPPTAKADNTALVTGDTWIADDGNVHMWITNQWVSKTIATDITVIEAEVAAQLVPYALDGLTIIHYESTQPTLVSHPKLDTDDLWYNTTTGKSYRCTNKSIPTWTEVVNQDISTALGDSADALAAVDKKIQFFNTTSEPGNTTANDLGFGDIWYKPGTATVGAVLKYWNNYSWVDTLMASQKFVSATVETEVTEVTGYCTSPTTGALWTGYPKKTQCQAAGGTWVDNSALAMLVTTLNTTVGGFSTTLQQDYVSKAGISGKYSVKIDNNGVVSGFGLSSGPDAAGDVKSDFIINADNFAILGKTAGGVPATDPADAINPFMVLYEQNTDGTYQYNTYIDNAYIKETTTGTLTVTELANLTDVTVAGGAFTSQYIDPDGNPAFSITNLKIDNGHIVGTLSSNSWSSSAQTGWKLSPDGSAYFGSDTVIDGTVTALAIKGDTKINDAIYDYDMPLVTHLAFTHPSMALDYYWLWYALPWAIFQTDVATYTAAPSPSLSGLPNYLRAYWGNVYYTALSGGGVMSSGASYIYTGYETSGVGAMYPGWPIYDGTTASWKNQPRTGVQAGIGGNYGDPNTTAWDTKTINESSSSYWVGPSSYLPEGRRFKSHSPVIKVKVSPNEFLYNGIDADSYLRLHVRYMTLSSATGFTDHGWFEFPHGIRAHLGGSGTVSGDVTVAKEYTWYAPQLNRHAAFAFGISSRYSDTASETHAPNIFITSGHPLYKSGNYGKGPKIPISLTVRSTVIEIEVSNM